MKYYIFSIRYHDEDDELIEKPFYLTTHSQFYEGTVSLCQRLEERMTFYRKMKNEGFVDRNKFLELLNNLIKMYNLPTLDIFVLEGLDKFTHHIIDFPDEIDSLKKDIDEIYKEMKIHDQNIIDDVFKKEFPSDIKREE